MSHEDWDLGELEQALLEGGEPTVSEEERAELREIAALLRVHDAFELRPDALLRGRDALLSDLDRRAGSPQPENRRRSGPPAWLRWFPLPLAVGLALLLIFPRTQSSEPTRSVALEPAAREQKAEAPSPEHALISAQAGLLQARLEENASASDELPLRTAQATFRRDLLRRLERP